MDASTRRFSWAASAAIHAALAGALLLVHYEPAPDEERHAPPILTELIYVPPATQPRATPPHLTTPKIPRPQSFKPAPFVSPVRPALPERKASIAAPEPELIAATTPAPAVVHMNTPDLPARRPAPAPVNVGSFSEAGGSPAATAPSPRLEVRTGSFGGPAAAPGASSGKVAGGVRTGGFGDAATSGATSSGAGRTVVADAGFGNAAASPVPARRVEDRPSETPVEVLWKPKPRYTDEARARKLEGNVTLEVVFRATGEVHVNRVVRGLGAGLDESARAAAEQIRFRPGRKDGVPVDRTGLVQITFELT